MIYLYITLVLMLVAVALWMIVCFHYVLSNKRKLNEYWFHLDAHFAQRHQMTFTLCNVLEASQENALKTCIAVLKEMLVADAALNWQDVVGRLALHKEIDRQSEQLFAAAQGAFFDKHAEFQKQKILLADNAAIIRKDAEQYNRAAQTYNTLLNTPPNPILAKKLGYISAPYYK